ncbi:MAG: RHS repeat-associated core domain-containing protein, partial [Firmicutes bacterium]|nr:RHS repeat-associated core domain-containing protein [Bacillota bacterium]
YNGLIYLRARYYDPEVGSFISRDSYPGNLMRPLSQNRYIYVENNPINYIDPSGHVIIGQVAAGAIGGAVVGFVGTLVTDIATNVVEHGLSIKEYRLSSIETYAANTVGVYCIIKMMNSKYFSLHHKSITAFFRKGNLLRPVYQNNKLENRE